MHAPLRHVALLTAVCWVATRAALDPQPAAQQPASDEQRCAAIAQLELETSAAGPARVTSARLTDMPPSGLDEGPNRVSGFGRRAAGGPERGGKLLIWHGLADSGIAYASSIGYYEAVAKELGGRATTDEFFRLLLIPGVHHCGGGPGLVEFDALTALEDWVEKGRAPDQLIASRSSSGVVERSRPVYPYPTQARYSGSGDPRNASSFIPRSVSN
jgi:hypothetical protein